MTTNVKIDAHCASNVHVLVVITADGNIAESFFLEDGQSAERYIYDNRQIIINEVKKGSE